MVSFKDVLGLEISHCFYYFIRRLSCDTVGRRHHGLGNGSSLLPALPYFQYADWASTCASKIISQTGVGSVSTFLPRGYFSLRAKFPGSRGLKEGR